VSFFEGATDTNSHGQQIPSFVDSNTADQMQTQHQDAEYPDTELREQRMQNYAMLVEAATLAREAEMGTTVNLRAKDLNEYDKAVTEALIEDITHIPLR